jgi:hypothetical protein
MIFFNEEALDVPTIKYIFKNYDENKTYFEAYQELLEKTRLEGTYDPSIGILDKWLWKYRDYRIADFRKLQKVASEEDCRLVGQEFINYICSEHPRSATDSLFYINFDEMDTYEKRRKIIDKYFFENNNVVKTDYVNKKLPGYIISGIIEHEARRLRSVNKRKFEE